MRRYIALLGALLLMVLSASAQHPSLVRARELGWDIELRAGASIGGAVPVPMPVEIREVQGYKAKIGGTIETLITKWFDPVSPMGLAFGIRWESRSMDTMAGVKDYTTAIESDGTQVMGVWTGSVQTVYSSASIAFPVQLHYRIRGGGRINWGLYGAYVYDRNFGGHVTDGHFREGSPIGEKVVFSPDERASYNFDDELLPWEVGFQVGGSWRAYRHFLVYGELRYSLSPLFRSNFEALSFSMHPLYLTAGFSYLF